MIMKFIKYLIQNPMALAGVLGCLAGLYEGSNLFHKWRKKRKEKDGVDKR